MRRGVRCVWILVFTLPSFTDFVFVSLGGEVGNIVEVSNILMWWRKSCKLC